MVRMDITDKALNSEAAAAEIAAAQDAQVPNLQAWIDIPIRTYINMLEVIRALQPNCHMVVDPATFKHFIRMLEGLLNPSPEAEITSLTQDRVNAVLQELFALGKA